MNAYLIVRLIILLFFGVFFLPYCQSQSKNENLETTLVARSLHRGLPLDPLTKEYESLVAIEIPLFPQLLIKPFGADQKPPIRVKAAHNGKEIVFLVEWEDKTKDRGGVIELNKFPDACALMFPQGEINDTNAASLMMGFLVPVEIWQWKNDRQRYDTLKDHPEYHGKRMLQALIGVNMSAENIQGKGPGTLQTKPTQPVLAKGVYTPGRWQVIFKRALQVSSKNNFPFEKGITTRMAFAIWDGAKKERGPQKSISDWIGLYIE